MHAGRSTKLEKMMISFVTFLKFLLSVKIRAFILLSRFLIKISVIYIYVISPNVDPKKVIAPKFELFQQDKLERLLKEAVESRVSRYVERYKVKPKSVKIYNPYTLQLKPTDIVAYLHVRAELDHALNEITTLNAKAGFYSEGYKKFYSITSLNGVFSQSSLSSFWLNTTTRPRSIDIGQKEALTESELKKYLARSVFLPSPDIEGSDINKGHVGGFITK